MEIGSLATAAFLITTGILAAYFFYRAYSTRKLKRTQLELEAAWGKAMERNRDMDRISAYHNKLGRDKQANTHSFKYIQDLHLDKVFSKLDRCMTKIGQQYLYSILHTPLYHSGPLERRNMLINFFQREKLGRLKAQLALSSLNEQLTYAIPNIIFDWKLGASPNKLLITVLSIMPVFILGLCIWVSKAFYLLLALSFFINLLFHVRNKSRVAFFISPFSQIPALRRATLQLSRLDKQLQDETVIAACDKLAAFGRYQFLLHSEKPGQNEFSSFLWLFLEYFKITFLVEINLLDKCLELSRECRSEIHTLYKFVGELDALQSIASYRTGLEYYCTPAFQEGTTAVEIYDAFHPLIDACTPNSFVSESKGIIITGSNMSGKTTFIRTIALNALLAQTIYTVCARQYRASFFKIQTSIGIQDDMLSGNSYYKEEIETIKTFFHEAAEPRIANLFVIDELFKGTNTPERIAGAKGVLEHLIEGNNLVFVSTHDLELSLLLSPAYSLYYFEEAVEAHGYVFDYKIKKGILKTRNAIRLLEVSGFPASVISAANTYLDTQR